MSFCKRKGNKSQQSQVAMIMLNKKSDISGDSLIKKVNEDWPATFQIKNKNLVTDDNSIVFDSKKINYGLTEIPIAIPEDDLDFPIKTAWYWENAKNDISKHQNHLIVFATGNTEKIEISKNLTMIVSSLFSLCDSIGVYLGASSQVIQTSLFQEYVNSFSDDMLIIPIWVKTTGYQNENKTFYLYTIGLSEYGQRESEIEEYPNDMSEGLFFLMEMVKYVIQNGPIIKDGNTVGETEDQKIKVKYKKSSLKPEEDVISILFK